MKEKLDKLLELLISFEIDNIQNLKIFKQKFIIRKSELSKYFSILKFEDNKSELGEMLNKIKAISQIKAELFEWFLKNELKYNL